MMITRPVVNSDLPFVEQEQLSRTQTETFSPPSPDVDNFLVKKRKLPTTIKPANVQLGKIKSISIGEVSRHLGYYNFFHFCHFINKMCGQPLPVNTMANQSQFAQIS